MLAFVIGALVPGAFAPGKTAGFASRAAALRRLVEALLARAESRPGSGPCVGGASWSSSLRTLEVSPAARAATQFAATCDMSILI